MGTHILDSRHDVHGRDARREAMATDARPLPGIKFHISAEKTETQAQADARRKQLAETTNTSRLCWR